MHCWHKLYGLLISLSVLVQTAQAALTITSNGADMSDSILSAVRSHDTVILDGSKGEFVLGHTVVLKHLTNKTIIGTHDACLRTRFRITPEIRAMLDSADIMRFPTAGEGGVLSNGMRVREQRELKTRQLFIDRFNDPEESFRASGGIQLSHCRNVTVRGLHLQGPGAIDVGGNDLLGMDHSTRIFIDSCVFMDGIDGNLDITSQSDSITVSRCYFGYSELSYDHMNSNLIGAADRVEADRGKLHVTYSYCTWGKGCRQRMPMVRFGMILLDHCRWECSTDHPVIDARREAKVVVVQPSFGEGVQIRYRCADDAQCIFR